jgi:hypothetical protein
MLMPPACRGTGKAITLTVAVLVLAGYAVVLVWLAVTR